MGERARLRKTGSGSWGLRHPPEIAKIRPLEKRERSGLCPVLDDSCIRAIAIGGAFRARLGAKTIGAVDRDFWIDVRSVVPSVVQNASGEPARSSISLILLVAEEGLEPPTQGL